MIFLDQQKHNRTISSHKEDSKNWPTSVDETEAGQLKLFF